MITENQNTAYEWNGGQWSALYSFASTGGVVHSETHRRNLIIEIEDCMNYDTTEQSEKTKLATLYGFVKSFEIMKGK